MQTKALSNRAKINKKYFSFAFRKSEFKLIIKLTKEISLTCGRRKRISKLQV